MDTSEKTVIVTGGNTGIGYVVARTLCQQGYDVVLGCRNDKRAADAVQSLQKLGPHIHVQYIKLDVGEPESVKEFVAEFRKIKKSLYCLVNNAGIARDFAKKTRQLNSKGWEVTMATNHMGAFLLSHLLLPELKHGAEQYGEARIVNVASSMHKSTVATTSTRGAIEVQPLDLEDLMLERPGSYSGIQAYKDSKLAIVMSTYAMARRLEGQSGVTVNCLCPGFIPTTGLNREASAMTRFFLRYVLGGLLKSRMNGQVVDVDEGGAAVLDLVTAEEYKGRSGNYFEHRKQATSSEESRDLAKQDKLLETTETLLGEYC